MSFKAHNFRDMTHGNEITPIYFVEPSIVRVCVCAFEMDIMHKLVGNVMELE